MDTYEARWMDIASAAGVLGVSERTIRRWEKSGDIASRREGRRVFVDVSAHMPQVEKTPDMLRQELASLRRDLDVARDMIRRQDEEIQYLRQANILALRLQRTALEQPAGDILEQDSRSWLDRLFGNK